MNKDIIKAAEKTKDGKEVLSILNNTYTRCEYVTENFSPSSFSEEAKREAFNYAFMSVVLSKITESSILHDNTTLTTLLAASMLKT